MIFEEDKTVKSLQTEEHQTKVIRKARFSLQLRCDKTVAVCLVRKKEKGCREINHKVNVDVANIMK